MLISEILPQIKPGCVYVTLGTIEQLAWICRNLGLEPELLYEPPTKLIRTNLEYSSFEYKAWIIQAKDLKGTGLKGTVLNDYLLPTDSFFYVHQDNYAFISVCGLEGEVEDKQVTAAKKLEGGCYKLLDLRRIEDLPAYPYVAEHELKYSKVIQTGRSSLCPEQSLIDSLNTIEGVKRWGNFTNGELRKWFVTPGIAEPVLLKQFRAQSLIPYIMPFLGQVEEQWSTGKQSVILKKFALWVYLSTEYWTKGSDRGLVKKASGKELINFYFYPSQKAREEWLVALGLQPSKKKEQ
jgi:hypothetical protein